MMLGDGFCEQGLEVQVRAPGAEWARIGCGSGEDQVRVERGLGEHYWLIGSSVGS